MQVQIQVDDRVVRQRLEQLRQAGGDLSPAMREIAGHLLDGIAESFASERGPGGAVWRPLKPSTVRERRRKGYGAGPILERSGDLLSRILADWDDTTAVAGTNVVYAATHHFGDPARGIPARPFLGLPADSRNLIVDTIVDHFAR